MTDNVFFGHSYHMQSPEAAREILLEDVLGVSTNPGVWGCAEPCDFWLLKHPQNSLERLKCSFCSLCYHKN